MPSTNTHFGDAVLTVTSHDKRVVASSNLVFPPHMDGYAQLAKAADCKSVTSETS